MKDPYPNLIIRRISVCLVILIMGTVSGCDPASESALRRIPFSEKSPASPLPLKISGLSLEKTGDFIYCRKPHGAVTIPGEGLGNTNSGRNIRRLTVSPGLKGDHIMELMALMRFLPGKPEQDAIRIRQKRNKGVVQAFTFKPAGGGLKRHRFELNLKKNDEIEFLVRSYNISAGIIGRPIFFAPPPDSQRRHFVFIIVADTLRRDSLGIYDPERKCSPSVDAFAREAVVFDRAYSTSPWTLPAHVSMFTGLSAPSHGVNFGNKTLPPGTPVLFEAMQKKFVTHCFNANGYMSGLYGFCRGFDSYQESFHDHNSRTASRDLFAKARTAVLSEKFDHALLLLHTYQIHTPYMPEARLAKKFFTRHYPGFEGYRFDPIRFIENGRKLLRSADKKQIADIQRIYNSGVFTFDHYFGHFLDFLRERKLYDDATIILLSDHGEEFNDHGAWEHGHSLYNELIHIPLIVKFPENRYAGRRVDLPVSIMDILPTLLELYRIPNAKSPDLEGTSLVDAIENHKDALDRTLIAYLGNGALRTGIPEKFAIITPVLKYIHQKPYTPPDLKFFTFPPPVLKHEMYDLKSDPHETRDIRFRYRDREREFIRFIKGLKLQRGRKGNLKQLEENLKSLGYL